MIKRIKCKTCDDDRDMIVCGDHFFCSSCGTAYDLEYIAREFYTPLMIEVSYILNDLNELGGCAIYGLGTDEPGAEPEISVTDELGSEDTEDLEGLEGTKLSDEQFLSSEDISEVEKATYCLFNYYYFAVEENNPDEASAFVDTVLKYDCNNFVACIIKALEKTMAIPRYILSRNGDVLTESLDSVPLSFDGVDGVKFSQELFAEICNKELAEHLQSILNLSLTSIRNAPTEELCRKIYHIVEMNLDLYEVLLQINTLNNLKELPTVERYREYIDHGFTMTECQKRLQQAVTARLSELDASQIDFDNDEPHFQEFFPDIPNWGCHLAEVEYQTAKDIWQKIVVAKVDSRTKQVDELQHLQVLDGIFVVGLLLGLYTKVDPGKVSDAGLHDLKIAQKMIAMLLSVISAVNSFSFMGTKSEDILASMEGSEELARKLAIIDGELARRHCM